MVLPYVPAVTVVFASVAVMEIVPLAKSVNVVLPDPVTSPVTLVVTVGVLFIVP